MQKNHYIPRLILRQFSENEKVNILNISSMQIEKRKIKDIFCEEQLFPKELEECFAKKLEGPFGDLLNHRLLHSKEIEIDRKDNFLIRKFELVHRLRSVYNKQDVDDIMRRAKEENNPTYLFVKSKFRKEDIFPTEKSYLSDLEMVMKYDSLEKLYYVHANELSPVLRRLVQSAITSYYAIWDSSETGEEFFLSKMPGIGLQDLYGPINKCRILKNYWMKYQGIMTEDMKLRFLCVWKGLMDNVDNYWILPISPTRLLVGISPYFKAFFPQKKPHIPALLPKSLFQDHFYEPTRMELFEPCETILNQRYTYHVKSLQKSEVFLLNSLFLNEELEELVFHDFTKIKGSIKAYEEDIILQKKKHNYTKLK